MCAASLGSSTILSKVPFNPITDFVTMEYALQHYADHQPLMLTGRIQYFPSVLSRVTRFKECVFPSMGIFWKNVVFEDCIFPGGILHFTDCTLKNCSFKPAEDVENALLFDGGQLQHVGLSGVWDCVVFFPNYTVDCVFEGDFFAHDLRLRIHCGSFGGVQPEGDVLFKLLAGMFYQNAAPIENMDLGESAMDAYRAARREIKKLLVAREGKER